VHPKLRPLHIQRITYQNAPALLLQDPFQLSGQYMALPQAYGPALYLLDGSRDVEAVRRDLHLRFGVRAEAGAIEALVAALDEAIFLENDRFHAAYEEALARYYAQPHRPMLIAGQGYPADPPQLKAQFDAWLAETEPVQPLSAGRVVLSPHIDYQRGHEVYAQLWAEARGMAAAAELVIILGTDHHGGFNPVTLTRQSYATPYGVLPTEQLLTDRLARAVGEETAFAGELYHLGEHSIELTLTWLHHMRDGRPVPVIPILTGSFQPFMASDSPPEADAALGRFLRELRLILAERPGTLLVAAGDLAHVGPAFDGQPVDEAKLADIRRLDDEMLDRLAAGDADGFWRIIKREQDANNICGVAPFYLTLKAAAPWRGHRVGYAVCPADEQNTSVVTIGGVIG